MAYDVSPAVEYVQWTTFCCGGCGLHWAVDSRWDADRREDGKSFWCPNGCSRVYRVTDLDRERKRRESAERELEYQRERAENHRRSLIATKGHITRLKKQMARGECPCCASTFKNVRRHMLRKHPEFIEEKGL